MRTLSVLDRAKYPVTLSDGRVIYSRHEYRRVLERQLEEAGLLHGVDARGLSYTVQLDAPRTSAVNCDRPVTSPTSGRDAAG